jgi:hypothetical protein
MKLTRREALGFTAAGIGTIALTGCNRAADAAYEATRSPIAPPLPQDDIAVATLNRFGFGPNSADLEQFNQSTPQAWFDSQLNPTDDEPTHLVTRLERLEINHLGPWDLRDWKEEAIIAQMQQAAILRATYSPWQLRERMVDFWTNHFNIYAKKGLAVYRKPWDERNVIRKHALGNFPDMIMASAKSTAMLLYLDQQASTAAHPNENYARELLELHTLGVEGGYTQKDVMEAARCFTGWSEERGFLKKKGAFLFIDEIHDKEEKVVLGIKIPAGGDISDGETVVRLAALHPSTARHITRKLCDYFLGDPDHKCQAEMAETFLKTDGNIPALLRIIHREFPTSTEPVIKRPLDFIVSALRATDAATDAGLPVQNLLAEMGQPLYLWPMPDGFPTEPTAWTASLLPRWNFASRLTNGGLDNTNIDPKRTAENLPVPSGVAIAFRRDPSSNQLKNLNQILKSKPLPMQIALALASPEYQWR